MALTGRGKLLPINGALNASRKKLGLEMSAWIVIIFVGVVAFLAGYKLLAVVLVPVLAGIAWAISRKHPKMFQLWNLGFRQGSYYDPRKR
ncbi:VirB3 family type IV secretion system protein [Acidipila sp. EB88]|uniref:VirB3 family type IV secretion system protein n=1 Tax=Acidipila sp. EB88 TaxID=2305226 RepID=UPI000F5FE8BC|nr:VirB3 family type IV secretion system protein [Acidipila sp. EB88]RRA50447.1 type VI secretion protein [Acidipila sp. EB88]